MLFYLFSADELGELFTRLGYPFEHETIPRNVAYYDGRSSHGSTLSRVVHAWALATLFALFPRLLVYPLTFVLVWIAATLLYRGYRLRRVKVGAKQERSHENHPRA